MPLWLPLNDEEAWRAGRFVYPTSGFRDWNPDLSNEKSTVVRVLLCACQVGLGLRHCASGLHDGSLVCGRVGSGSFQGTLVIIIVAVGTGTGSSQLPWTLPIALGPRKFSLQVSRFSFGPQDSSLGIFQLRLFLLCHLLRNQAVGSGCREKWNRLSFSAARGAHLV